MNALGEARPDSAGPIWLVRHASTAWTARCWCGRSDPPLTASGRVEADRVAEVLATDLAQAFEGRPTSPTLLLTSPLRRARGTAAAIERRLGSRSIVVPDLVEIDFGAVDGLTWDQLATAHPALADAVLAGIEPDWPGGESAAVVGARAGKAAEQIVAEAGSGPVIVVSHGGLLRAIGRHVSSSDSVGPFEPASVVQLELDPDRRRWRPAGPRAVTVR